MVDGEALIARLPPARGRLEPNRSLAEFTWFRAGGPAEVLFTPADESDLADFLSALAPEIPVTVIGVGSNLLVRDGGVLGVVVRLGRGFSALSSDNAARIRAGAAVLDVRVARFALDQGVDGLTFLRGIPGTIGGALRMNAGAHGGEMKDVLVEATAVDRRGARRALGLSEMGYSYRQSEAGEDLIFTSALLQGRAGEPSEIARHMHDITAAREASQPIKSRTGGSTFKNPPGARAWELIDRAGLRGVAIGAARVSTMHCNFLINEGEASASDIEELGESIRQRVLETSGVWLEWEIKRIGLRLERAG
jgi:UDP-N-acetylmuramate dehydrogenase